MKTHSYYFIGENMIYLILSQFLLTKIEKVTYVINENREVHEYTFYKKCNAMKAYFTHLRKEKTHKGGGWYRWGLKALP